jgi:hypothetical protein
LRTELQEGLADAATAAIALVGESVFALDRQIAFTTVDPQVLADVVPVEDAPAMAETLPLLSGTVDRSFDWLTEPDSVASLSAWTAR